MAPTVSSQVRAARPEISAGSGEILALLVSDVVGFTALVERVGDAAAKQLVEQHDRLLFTVLEGHGGREVVHTGDGLLAVFHSVSDALEAATEIQRAVSEHSARCPDMPLRVRIAVHAGEPLPIGDRLIGTSVNTAFRVCTAAKPGRILVTDLARRLAAGKGFEFGPVTRVRAKGLRELVPVYALRQREALSTQLAQRASRSAISLLHATREHLT